MVRGSVSRRLLALARLGAAAFSGVLLFIAFEPSGLWWAAPLGMALFVAVATPRLALLMGWIQAAVLYVFMLPWVGEFVGASAWLALAALQSLFGLVFGFGLRWLLRWHPAQAQSRVAWWVFAPGVAAWFVVSEWLRSSVPFGGFAWGRLAWGQIDGPLASLISLGGPAVVTFAVVFLGAAVAQLWWLVIRRGHGWQPPVTWLGLVSALAIFAMFFDAVPGLTVGPTPAASHINAVAIQGNVPRMGLDFNSQRRAVLDNHVSRTHDLAVEVQAGTAVQPDVVFLPENAADINPYTNADAAEALTEAAGAIGAPMLVGTVVPQHNRMVVWTQEGPGDTHDKRFLQPFGEYMPLRDLLSKVNSYVDRAGNFQPGTGNGLLTVQGQSGDIAGSEVLIGVATCYEVAFDEAYRSSVRAGAQILTTPTNNATFGFTDMTYQQLAMSRMRAIEYDRAVVVAATSGASAMISPDGTVLQQSRIFTGATLQAKLPLKNSVTISALVGPWVEWTLCALGGLLLIAAWLAAQRQARPQRNRKRRKSYA